MGLGGVKVLILDRLEVACILVRFNVLSFQLLKFDMAKPMDVNVGAIMGRGVEYHQF